MLDRETIEKIEDLHAAVVRAEAEQRFGLLRGKRTRQVAEAEAAEQAFLHEHGFATYNDFRLRIRRSTVVEPDNMRAPWEDGYSFDVAAEARFEAATFDDRPGHHDADDAYPARDDDPPAVPLEGSDEMASTPDPVMSQQPPAVPAFAPDPVAPPIPTFTPSPVGDAGNVGLPAAPPAPASGPAPVHRSDDEPVSPATADLRRLTEPLFATLQAETDRYIAARIDAAEKQAADIVARASKEGAELVAKASRMQEAARALLDDVARQAEAFMGHTEELAAHLGQARQSVGTGLQALRELGERAHANPPVPSDGPATWAPPRLSPPAVSAVASVND
ncbi:MAG TPA: hypothetical protein VMU14_13670 [Acidimicrobiales bacterium]|nr:hypothetical protein [Acidimicrobiales bacterium]